MLDIVKKLRLGLVVEPDEAADEIERLREESDYLGELLLECLDQYIPFKDLDLRSRIKKAIGDE